MRVGGLKVLVLEALLCDQSQQGSPLDLPGFGVEEDADKDQHGPRGPQDGNAVAEDEDAEPH